MKRLLLLALTCATLLACNHEPGEPKAQIAGYPRTVETFEGETLVLTRPPLRVLASNAGALELLADLGELDRSVAIPTTAFEYSNLELEPDDWKGRTFEKYLVEAVLSRSPDLVITHSWQNPETSDFLANSGIAVLALPTPETFGDLLRAIRVTASVLELDDRGETLCADLEERRALLNDSGNVAVRVMTYTTFGTGSWTAAKNTTADVLIRIAGMRNASAEHGLEGHAAIDIETLLGIDPDYIVVSGTAEDPRWSVTLESMRNDPTLATLRALREDRILVLPLEHFVTNSHYLLDAAEALAAAIR